MLYEEFIKLAGYDVDVEDYDNIIEPMYMATDVDKHDFINMLNRKYFEVKGKSESDYIEELKELAQIIYKRIGSVVFSKFEDDFYDFLFEYENNFIKRGSKLEVVTDSMYNNGMVADIPVELVIHRKSGDKTVNLLK